MRPAVWPLMAAHSALGYVLAVGVDGLLWGDSRGAAVTALLIWVVPLTGGSFALNSAFDDDGHPDAPKYLLEFSLALMVGGLTWAFSLPLGFRIAYGVGLVMSVLHSVPPFRFKAATGVDWIFSMWGGGSLTPYAAYAATGKPLDLTSALVLLAFSPLMASLYLLTRLYRLEDATTRGDRTITTGPGMARSLWVATAAAGLAHVMLFAAWTTRTDIGYAWDPGIRGGVALGASAAIWLGLLARWLRRCRRMAPDRHRVAMYRALGAWAMTGMAVLFAFAV